MPLPPATHQTLQSLIASLISLQTTGGPAATRRAYSFLFRDLPDKWEYADYYQLIKEPRCLNGVMDSLKKGIYSTPQAVAYDLFLIWSNAREYNQQGSQVYNDAEKLESHMQKLWKDKTPPLPPFASLPRPGTLPPSATSNPEPKAKRIKIKSTSLGGPVASTSTTPIIRRTELPPRAAPPPPPPVAGPSTITLKLGGPRPVPTPPPPQPSTSSAPPHSSISTKIILPLPQPPAAPPLVPKPPTTPTDIKPPALKQASPTAEGDLGSAKEGRKRAREDEGDNATASVPGSVVKKESRKDRRAREKAARASENAAAQNIASATEGGNEDTQQIGQPTWLPDEESGWMSVESAGPDSTAKYLEILNSLRSHTDSSGRTLAGPLLTAPDRAARPDYYKLVNKPIALDVIENRVKALEYPTPEAFDRDLHHLFTVAKLFIKPETPGTLYSDLVVLQRLYQEETKNNATPSAARKYALSGALASVPTGPGNIQFPRRADSPGTAGDGSEMKSIANSRPAMKDRTFLNGINFKGEVLKVGDWIHLVNPDHPGKPVIAQIFKVYTKPDSPGRHLSVCWYYRPEETIHPASRQFYEHEVFKTSNFVDHSVEDFIGRSFVMFFTKYVRGRPKFPVWDPSVPLYVCEHRYKDELKSFKKIKNWASCVPEEIRAHEYPFELWSDGRTDILKRVRSPFVRGVVGPGGIGEAIENEEEEQARYHVLPGGEPATVQKLRAAKEAEEANQREELQRSVLYGGNPATSTPAAVPNFSGQQPRAQVFAPATTLGFTLAEAAIRTESFQPLPPSIQAKFRSDDAGDLLWFAAPALVPSVPKRPSHSSVYLKWKAEQAQKQQ